ncbi:MAG: hypothetical protein N2748_01475, partial [candidate division WOR-3 bacterium]|nr:hypothetical protein [candidate division WOR-3 bacterium]
MFANILCLATLLMQTNFTNLEFAYTYTLNKHNDSTYTLNLYYEIPYRNLYFYKAKDHFFNRYDLYCQLFHRQLLVAGEIFTKTIYVDSYDNTMQSQLKHRDQIQLTFSLPNPKISSVKALVNFQDRHSTNQASYRFKVNLPDLYSPML